MAAHVPFAERLQRVRNWQSSEFYAALVVRPIAIVVMLVIADWRWVTPNRLTALATLAKLGAVATIVTDHFVWAAALLQLGLLLDHLDGTLARYRGTGSSFGSFFDKVSDLYTWLAITTAIGWVMYERTGRVDLLLMASLSALGQYATGYMKWLTAIEEARLKWRRAKADPAAAVARETKPPAPSLPPERTPKEWARFILSRLSRIVLFEEVDLFFWVGLALVLDRLEWVIWALAVSQGLQVLISTVWRAGHNLAFDRERAALAAAPAPEQIVGPQ
ncbi:MAG: CDP-alcohol phosphatidyltransferase family protein [Myxococcales bacterium]|nr:CDP-alcohol phosphatidyltransferase family protein [Myxococcales bacterium]